jgi:hypothetical protein
MTAYYQIARKYGHRRRSPTGKDACHLDASLKDFGKKWFAFSKMGMGGIELLGKIKGVTA